MGNKSQRNRMRHLMRSNGHAPASIVSADAAHRQPAPEVRTPGEAEASAVRAAEQAVVVAKLQTADALALLRQTEARSTEAQAAFQAAAVSAARAVGIDPENPAGGRWHFDAQAMTFTRTA